MGAVSLESFIVFYLLTGLTFILALWIYYDRRDHLFYDVEREGNSYFCVQCEHIYGLRRHRKMGECPVCGRHNPPLGFN